MIKGIFQYITLVAMLFLTLLFLGLLSKPAHGQELTCKNPTVKAAVQYLFLNVHLHASEDGVVIDLRDGKYFSRLAMGEADHVMLHVNPYTVLMLHSHPYPHDARPSHVDIQNSKKLGIPAIIVSQYGYWYIQPDGKNYPLHILDGCTLE